MIPLNPQGKPFTWSYSSLTDYEGCPARYAAKRFYCTTKELPTEATIWGERVHKAFEERIRDGKAFDSDMPATYEPWARALEKLPGTMYFERKVAIQENYDPCEFFSPEAYGRGVIDLLSIDGPTAALVDYKTGKVKNDETQLKLFCWFVANEHPDVETFKYRYLWLKTGTVTGGVIKREELMAVEVNIRLRVSEMQRAWVSQNFPMCPSGLCGWCPVEECVHWRKRR